MRNGELPLGKSRQMAAERVSQYRNIRTRFNDSDASLTRTNVRGQGHRTTCSFPTDFGFPIETRNRRQYHRMTDYVGVKLSVHSSSSPPWSPGDDRPRRGGSLDPEGKLDTPAPANGAGWQTREERIRAEEAWKRIQAGGVNVNMGLPARKVSTRPRGGASESFAGGPASGAAGSTGAAGRLQWLVRFP